MPFITKENFGLVPGTENVILQGPLKYKIPDNFPVKEYRGVIVTAPGPDGKGYDGFVCDLASVPQFFLNIFRKLGKNRKGAVIHDWLYKTGMYSKKIADLIFLYAMIESGVNKIKRQTMYRTVKYFGYFAWKNHRKKDKEKE